RATVGVPGLSEVRAADHAGANLFHCFHDLGPAAALVAHLYVTLVLAGCLHHPFAFLRVVAARLLDIYVLPGGTAQNRARGVPVVARGYHENIHLLVVEDSAKVLNILRRTGAVPATAPAADEARFLSTSHV